MAVTSRIKVAVAQVATDLNHVARNMERHRAFIEDAKAAGATLLMFPELSLTGYQVADHAVDVAMAKDDPRLLSLAEAAGEMTVIVGFVEEGYAAQFYNAAAVLRRGRVDFIHRKINLPSYGRMEEDKYFAEGRYVEVFTLERPWDASLLICADLWNPGLVHLAALHGATLMLSPIASANEVVGGDFSNPEGWDVTLKFYAMMYGMPVVMANIAGREGGLHFWGGSRILDPHGSPLAQAEGDEEVLLTAELDYDAVRRARFALPTVRDSNLDLIHREVDRLVNRVGVPVGVRRTV